LREGQYGHIPYGISLWGDLTVPPRKNSDANAVPDRIPRRENSDKNVLLDRISLMRINAEPRPLNAERDLDGETDIWLDMAWMSLTVPSCLS
jgi:hypothetical protein